VAGDSINRESEGLSEESFDFLYDEDTEECYECGSEGWITGDCFEDTCCCADPDEEHGIIPCPRCNPAGAN
jgi:hypothetical protein